LSILCMEMLRRDPQARPRGDEVLRRLSSSDPLLRDSQPTPLPSSHRLEVPLIGRKRHLRELTDALEETRTGRTVLVEVHGRSGAGKSALVQRFLDDLREDADTVILMGRCYEQESVPYKALDNLIDALSRYLERLPAAEAQALWPRDLAALARVFPVLRRLGSGGCVPRGPLEMNDPQEVRRRALSALRELLARLGDRRPLVLAIDDVQWGDEDSAALLTDLLRPPDQPTLLLLLCYRREETDSSPCLRALRKIQEPGGPERKAPKRAMEGQPVLRKTRELGELERLDLPVEPLSPAERRELAPALLDSPDETAAARGDSIARQSGGYPFFVYELVQHLQGGASSAERPSKSGDDVSLSTVLWSRICRLPEEARRLLEIVAVASRPLYQSDACQAAEVGEEHTALACLRAGRLLRSSGPGEHGEIETYHDRIRETVLLN